MTVAIAINASNASYQKKFLLFSFLRSAYGKFEEISREICIEVFLVHEFFLPSELFNESKETFFQENCLSNFFKLSQMETKKYLIKVYLISSFSKINPYGNQALV